MMFIVAMYLLILLLVRSLGVLIMAVYKKHWRNAVVTFLFVLGFILSMGASAYFGLSLEEYQVTLGASKKGLFTFLFYACLSLFFGLGSWYFWREYSYLFRMKKR